MPISPTTRGWQWVAGCGTDAAPYFRIFNPVIQGEKFDPNGAYVRRWVPELAGLPVRTSTRRGTPRRSRWARPVSRSAKTYPKPIVDHATARARALAAFKRL